MFHVAKAICAAESRQEDGSHQNRPVPFKVRLCVSISHLPTAVKLLPVGGSEALLKRV